MFLFGAAVLALASSMALPNVGDASIGPHFVPMLLASIIMCMSALLAIVSLRLHKDAAPLEETHTPSALLHRPLPRVLLLLCVLVSYILALDLVGYRISTVAFMAILFVFKGMRNPVWVCAGAVLLMYALYLLFYVLLGIPLPVGTLTELR
jgi:putative tricarboxylic transport membrane protein